MGYFRGEPGDRAPKDHTAPVPWWRAALGVAVSIVGTVVLFLPALFAFFFVNDYKNGNCRASGPSPTRATTRRLRGTQSRS